MFFWKVLVESELPGMPQGTELVGVVAGDVHGAIEAAEGYVELRPTFQGKGAHVVGLSREAAVNVVAEGLAPNVQKQEVGRA